MYSIQKLQQMLRKVKKTLMGGVKRENPLLKFCYENIYLRYRAWKNYNVHVDGRRQGDNSVVIPKSVQCDNLRITFRGNGNKVVVGKGCKFKQTNAIYIQGDGNSLHIGDNVTFDQDVSIVMAEGTRCEIGSDCIFAKGVRIRTSDQHSIFDSAGTRINCAKDVNIGNHVWLGASVIVMKGVTIEDGSVVGMDSMVTRDIPADSIAVGKPAKVIKAGIHWQE